MYSPCLGDTRPAVCISPGTGPLASSNIKIHSEELPSAETPQSQDFRLPR